MNTISEGVRQGRPNTQLALVSTQAPGKDIPKVGDPDESGGFKLFGDDGFTFKDFIDVINPLQHIPVIGTMYREMSGDTLDPGSRVVGGTLFLGPFGTVSALANVMVDDATGKDMGEHLLALFEDPEAGGPEVSGIGPVAIAAAPTSISAIGGAASKAIDPVTAWAQAEASYRQPTPARVSILDSAPSKQQAAVSLSQNASVADWARAEASYRKAVLTQASAATPAIAQASVSSQPSTHQATRGISALAALRKDLQAGGQRTSAQVPQEARSIRQQPASLAAARYARQQPAPLKQAGPQRGQSSSRPAPGAIATEGGWFTETMLSALGKVGKNGDGSKQAGSVIHPTMTGALRQAPINLSR
ncbi:MAG: hypothetical protein HQ494_11820 [Rhodospirillales bacterium]|nr:hypothetical protein [Rhodospirillales bacterium]